MSTPFGALFSLSELRKACGLTQGDVAATMGLDQPKVSRLEKRADLRITTLARFAQALGGRLVLVIELPDGQRVQLDVL